MKASLKATLLTTLLVAGCGGSRQDTQTTQSLREIPPASVTSITASADGEVQLTVANGALQVGEVVTTAPSEASGQLFPIMGRVTSTSSLQGAQTAILKPVLPTEVFRQLNVSIDTAKDGFQIVKVILPNSANAAAANRKSAHQSAGKQASQPNVNFETSNNLDGTINFKGQLEIPLENGLKASGSLSVNNLRTQKTLAIKPGCAFAGCTLNDVGSYEEVGHNVSGEWVFDINLEGSQNVKGLNGSDIALSSILDPTEQWKVFKRKLGPLSVSGLDGSDKAGLYPLFGLVLASSSLPPLTPITVSDGLLRAAAGPTVLMIVYIKLDGSLKLKGTFTPIRARGKLDRTITLKATATDGALIGTTASNISDKPTAATAISGELEASASIGVAASVDLLVSGIRPLSITSELLAIEEKRSFIGTSEITWIPSSSFTGYYCTKGSTRWFSSFSIAGALSMGLNTVNGESVPKDGLGFNWKKEVNWSEVPTGINACRSIGRPKLLATEIGDSIDGRKVVLFDYSETDATLKSLADRWIVSAIAPAPLSLPTTPTIERIYASTGTVNASTNYQFTISAYSDTYGEISVSDAAPVSTTAFVPPHVPVAISSIQASQSTPGSPISGSFTITGSDVTRIRVHARQLNAFDPAFVCFIELPARLGLTAFNFSGTWPGASGACRNLWPAVGETKVIEFLFDVLDSKGNSAGICSSGPGPGECRTPSIWVSATG